MRLVPASPSNVSDLLILAAFITCPQPTEAQQHIEVAGPPACGSCQLTITRSVVIHDEGGEAGLAGHPLSIARASTGDIFLVSRQFEPLWFRATGEFVGTLGRRGEGPGEYSAVRIVSTTADTLFTYDFRLARRSRWTLNGEYISSDRIPSISFDAPVSYDDGSFVISRPYRRPETIGFPFHQFSRDGEWLYSFGPESPVRDGVEARRLARILAPAPNETFWASHRYEYTLEHFTKSGEQLAQLSRVAEWFQGPSDIRPVSPDAPPLPNVRSLRVDGHGVIWVLTNRSTNRVDFRGLMCDLSWYETGRCEGTVAHGTGTSEAAGC